MRVETPLPYAEDQVWRALAGAAGLVFVDLRGHYVSGGTRARLPASLARARRWAPFIVSDCRVVLAVDDPCAALAFDSVELSRLLGPPWGRAFSFVLAAPSALSEFIERHYPPEEPPDAARAGRAAGGGS